MITMTILKNSKISQKLLEEMLITELFTHQKMKTQIVTKKVFKIMRILSKRIQSKNLWIILEDFLKL